MNREINSDRANGVNTSTLIISPVTEQDEDEYYCVASNGGADGLLYNDKSHDAIITVYGKLCITLKCQQYKCYYACNVFILYLAA